MADFLAFITECNMSAPEYVNSFCELYSIRLFLCYSNVVFSIRYWYI